MRAALPHRHPVHNNPNLHEVFLSNGHPIVHEEVARAVLRLEAPEGELVGEEDGGLIGEEEGEGGVGDIEPDVRDGKDGGSQRLDGPHVLGGRGAEGGEEEEEEEEREEQSEERRQEVGGGGAHRCYYLLTRWRMGRATREVRRDSQEVHQKPSPHCKKQIGEGTTCTLCLAKKALWGLKEGLPSLK